MRIFIQLLSSLSGIALAGPSAILEQTSHELFAAELYRKPIDHLVRHEGPEDPWTGSYPRNCRVCSVASNIMLPWA